MVLETQLPPGLNEIARADCLRLLAENRLGRLAVNATGWTPLIRPVDYVFDERSQSVVFASAESSKLTSLLRSQRVAFETDGLDGGGWSVIVLGPVEEITNASERGRFAGRLLS